MSAPARNNFSIISLSAEAGPRVANCFVDFLHLCASLGTAATVVVDFAAANFGSKTVEDCVEDSWENEVVEESIVAKRVVDVLTLFVLETKTDFDDKEGEKA